MGGLMSAKKSLSVTCLFAFSLHAVLILHVSGLMGLLSEAPLAVVALVEAEVVVAGEVDLERVGLPELPAAILVLAKQNLPRLARVLKQDAQLIEFRVLHHVSYVVHFVGIEAGVSDVREEVLIVGVLHLSGDLARPVDQSLLVLAARLAQRVCLRNRLADVLGQVWARRLKTEVSGPELEDFGEDARGLVARLMGPIGAGRGGPWEKMLVEQGRLKNVLAAFLIRKARIATVPPLHLTIYFLTIIMN